MNPEQLTFSYTLLKHMQVILQGSLRHFPLAELLPYVCRRTESGTLDIETTGRRARIFFSGGKIAWAESPRGATAIDAAVEGFDWPAGSFTLLDSAVLPEGATALDLEVEALIDEARRRAQSAAGYADSAHFRVVDDPALQQQVSLTADEFKLLFRVGSGRTFRELTADLPIPKQELVERLQRLEQIGLISVMHAQPSADPTAPQPKIAVARKRTLVGSLTPDAAPDTVWPLLDSEYTIGRSSTNAIAIADASISSNHARIIRTGEGFVLEDLQSRNGSFINGERVTAPRLLVDGDLIRLGKVIMTFNLAREGKAGEETQPEVRLG